MTAPTNTTTNEKKPLEGFVSRCCGQDHKQGEDYNERTHSRRGYCSLCDEPVKFISIADYYQHDLGDDCGGEDRHLDSYWQDRVEMSLQ